LGDIIKDESINMKLLLTSGGLTNPTIEHALSKLINIPNTETNVVFIPTAANIEEGDKEWLLYNYLELKKQSYRFIDIVDISALPQDIWLPRLKKANAIFVGGGNTYYLMAWLKKSGLSKLFPELLKTRVYVGISAGSILVTPSLQLSTSPKKCAEKIYPIDGDAGLGLVNFQIRPHLNNKHFPKLTIDYIQQAIKEISDPVYAIDDNTAVLVNENNIEVASEGLWKKFSKNNS